MNSTPDKESISAWEVHKDADGIFYAQIHAFIFAQAFLVAAYATIVSSSSAEGHEILAHLVGVVGFVVSAIWLNRLHKNLRRLTYLKRNYLIRSDVYQSYLARNTERSSYPIEERRLVFDQKDKSIHPLAHMLPILFLLFWPAAIWAEFGFFFCGS
jgi:hypothetical protein